MKRHPRPEIVPAILIAFGLLLTGCGDSSDSSEPDSAPLHHLVEKNGAPLEPGTYQMSVAAETGTESPEVLVTVPSGYVESSDWYLVSDDGEEFLAVYAVERVMHDGCHETSTNIFTPGPTVQDLADALVAQTSTTTTKPEPVTVAGHEGLYLELTGPSDTSKCVKVPAGPWQGRNFYGDNQVERVWILDVDGQRLVVDAAHAATSPASDNDKLTSLVDSLEFTPAA